MNGDSMNRSHTQITDDELDRHIDTLLLAEDDVIAPPSGFTESVMRALHEDTAQPSRRFAPIEFPWKRVIPGAAIACIAIALLIVAMWNTPFNTHTGSAQIFSHLVDGSIQSWTGIAALLTAGSLVLTWRLTREGK
jgi:hypothetical protein